MIFYQNITFKHVKVSEFKVFPPTVLCHVLFNARHISLKGGTWPTACKSWWNQSPAVLVCHHTSLEEDQLCQKTLTDILFQKKRDNSRSPARVSVRTPVQCRADVEDVVPAMIRRSVFGRTRLFPARVVIPGEPGRLEAVDKKTPAIERQTLPVLSGSSTEGGVRPDPGGCRLILVAHP